MIRPFGSPLTGVVAAILLVIAGCNGAVGGDHAAASMGPSGAAGAPAVGDFGAVAGAYGAGAPSVEPAPVLPPGEMPASCAEITPGPSALRRLTYTQYDAVVSDLFGRATSLAAAFPPEPRSLNFTGIAAAQSVNALLVEGYQNAARVIAEEVVAGDALGLVGCDVLEEACANAFLRDWGRRMYRRPLADAEVAQLQGVLDWGVANQTVADGVEMVLEVLLQSPDFLYRPEFGASEVVPGVRRLTSLEMASRLSFFLIGSTPDAALLAAAEADLLTTPDQVLEHAERLLASPAAREMFSLFHRQWLDLDAIKTVQRDASVYAGFTEATPALLAAEAEHFIDHVLFVGSGSLQELFTAKYTLTNAQLATYYGVAGPTSDAFERVELPEQYAGLLTQGGLLARNAHAFSTSPVHRGKFVRETLLCQIPPPPPENVDIELPEILPGVSTRERFNQHSADVACSGCHQLMDPIGLVFEAFDASGRYRELEDGLPIDTTGQLVATDVDGPLNGVAELGVRLAQSAQVEACIGRQWLRFALGRSETPEDACTLAELNAAFAASGGDLRAFAKAIVQSDAFLYLTQETQP